MPTTFVGRNKEIEAIKAGLSKKDNLYISLYGPGGIGKTKILNEISRLAITWGYTAIPIIDFTETRSRSIIGLLSDLVSKLGEEYFAITKSVIEQFNSTDGEKRLLLGQQIINEFLSEYQRLSLSKRILVLFDTFEIVQTTEIGENLIPLLCKSTSRGSVMIIAGQKPVIFSDRSPNHIEGMAIELQGFSLSDAEELVNQKLGSTNSTIKKTSISQLYYLSNRHPLIIDLALSAILETGAEESLLNAGADEFEKKCITWLQNLPKIKLQVIMQSTILDQRYDLSLMAYLNQLSEDDCRHLYEDLASYPFVKIDETKIILGIHDDMRFKIYKYLNPPNWLYTDLYSQAIKYYKEIFEPALDGRELLFAHLERMHYQLLLDLNAHYPEWTELFATLLNRYDLDLCHELLVEIKRHSSRLGERQKYEIELLEGELNLVEYDPLKARSRFEYLISVLDVAQYPQIVARALRGLIECATNNCTIDSSYLSGNLQNWEHEIQTSSILEQDKELLGSLMENIGQACQLLGMHIKAEEYYLQAKHIYEENLSDRKLADILEKIGVLYREQYRPNEALTIFRESLQIRENEKDTWGIGRLYNKMALVYGDIKEAKKAEDLYLKSIGYLEQINDPAALTAAYGGFAWFKFITRDMSDDNLNRAEEYAQKAIAIEEDKGFGRGLSRDYHTLFHVIELQKGIKEAEPYIRKACDYARSFADPFMFFDTLVHVAKIDYERGDYSNLQKYLNEIEDFEKRGTKFSVFKGRLLVLLGHVAIRESNIPEAIVFYQSGWPILVHNRTASTVPPLPREFQDFVNHLRSLSITRDVKQRIGKALNATLTQKKLNIEGWEKIESMIQDLIND
jgi:tetratricopeptide (TPR) repeat protein